MKSENHTSSGTDAFLPKLGVISLTNLAPCLQPTYLKTHDCNTEVLLCVLHCTLKHNYARLKCAKHCLRNKI